MSLAYFMSNQTYSITELDITYTDVGIPNNHIVTIPTGKNINDLIIFVNADFITNTIPLIIKLDDEFIYFENTDLSEEITDVTWTGNTDDLIAIGGDYNYSSNKAISSLFGVRLPFDFILISPVGVASVNNMKGGVTDKFIKSKLLAGETFNGVNDSSSSKHIRKLGWSFDIRINEPLINSFDWFIESCRNSSITIYNASDYNLSDSVTYKIQLDESNEMSVVYSYLDIYDTRLSMLEY